MDRLICGDVGFGKTEVALRAAFVVAMSGQQVAVVCPTTLLARQHFKTFQRALPGLAGARCGRLSRLVPAAEAAETREALAKGEVEIVVGTHAVLSKQVELQGPGPGHRRRGAALRGQAQGGAEGPARRRAHADPDRHADPAHPADGALGHPRDVDHRHPAGRPPGGAHLHHARAIRSSIREALLREKYRGGQAYYVAPRISDLPDLEKFLREQVPEVKFVVGHGQMAPTQLEDVMSAFYDGQYDVLLSTTIVEIRPGHPHRQHPDRPPRRHVRPGPALPAARPGRPGQGARLRLSDHAVREADHRRRRRSG